MTDFYIVRHCESTGNVSSKLQGRTDTDITDKGASQLAMLAMRLKPVPIDFIYSSPLKRAYKTAQSIAAVHPGIDIRTEQSLQEIDFGEMEGEPVDTLSAKWLRETEKWSRDIARFKAPGGESTRDIYIRAAALLRRLASEHSGRTICLATHGCVIFAALSFANGLSAEDLNQSEFWVDNTAISHIRADNDGNFELIFWNDTEHITGSAETAPHREFWRKLDN